MLYLIRHAPVSSVHGLFLGNSLTHGHEIVPVDPSAVHRALAACNPEHYYSSPVPRCVFTAQALFPSQQVFQREDLAERGLGVWEGESKADCRHQFPEAFLRNGKMDPTYCPGQAETWIDFAERVRLCLLDLSSSHGSRDVIACTHNGFIKVATWLRDDPGLTVDGLRRAFYNDVPHVQPIKFNLDTGWLKELQISNRNAPRW